MPIITKEMSADMARAKWRPRCYRCGRFVGIGGFYDALPEDTEEGYSACAEHAKKFNPATGEQGEGR